MKCLMLMTVVGMSAAAMALDVAKENWKVPNWCPIVSEQGAVKEWIGKTWSGHVQGVVKFAELKDGNFMDITRYGVFDKQIER